MHAVVETDAYLRAADRAGLTEKERETVVLTVSGSPLAGEEIRGTGGCRKLRIAGRGKGKSGGYRVIAFYSGVNVPVFLVTVFSKGQRADLTQRERNGLAQLTKMLVPSLGSAVQRLMERRS